MQGIEANECRSLQSFVFIDLRERKIKTIAFLFHLLMHSLVVFHMRPEQGSDLQTLACGAGALSNRASWPGLVVLFEA